MIKRAKLRFYLLKHWRSLLYSSSRLLLFCLKLSNRKLWSSIPFISFWSIRWHFSLIENAFKFVIVSDNLYRFSKKTTRFVIPDKYWSVRSSVCFEVDAPVECDTFWLMKSLFICWIEDLGARVWFASNESGSAEPILKLSLNTCFFFTKLIRYIY